MKVAIRELIAFFDEEVDARTHASAVKAVAAEEVGLALLVHYFSTSGTPAELLDLPCTTGKQKGPRLDGWLHVKGTPDVLYQVEVKAWSFHSIGGVALRVDASSEDVARYKALQWKEEYWSGNGFREDELDKVFTPMLAPAAYSTVAPLACIWTAVHPDGLETPLFHVPVSGRAFPSVTVFSMSAYLRHLLRSSRLLELPLPQTEKRMAYLHGIFPVPTVV